ncbi:MAG: M6 family metalloprotease domain-containing protein [Prevotella sp.]|nr:M6 family metalloprotease domain-containing protein [Prevotella sp.]
MRKILLSLFLLLTTLSASAISARRGAYRMLRLADGTEVRAQLCGDEHIHYYRADDGTCYTRRADGIYVVADMDALRAKARSRRAPLTKRQERRVMSRVSGLKPSYGFLSDGIYGKKKGLIILVQFQDLKFRSGHDKAFYDKVANQENLTEGDFVGSVHDYFQDQSNGQFDLTFDVVGPVTLSKGYAYYGQNGDNDDDAHAGAMVAEACQAVKSQVDWSSYDWDGDGEADQVFCIYAGYSEADDMGDDYIWPHMYYLSAGDYGSSLSMNGTVVDTYACSNEISELDKMSGIGAICHEFSHCLGFPDVYDTDTGNGYAMGYLWDLMDGGDRNGDSFCPAGYSGIEKWIAGWAEPVVLDADTEVRGWKSAGNNGETYVIYNNATGNEFYALENRQRTKWDAELPGTGMLVTHVDYSERAWYSNEVNNVVSHQRWSIVAADNSYGMDSYSDIANDTYPYKGNNRLTGTSKPANKVFNKNTDGTYLLGKNVTAITANADGTMSFDFKVGSSSDNPAVKPDGAAFYESFDGCSGKGGNDNQWSGNLGSGKPSFDNTGWTYNYGYASDQCVRLGKSGNGGNATTPSFTVSGKARLTFKAAAWVGDKNTLTVSYGGQTLQAVTLSSGQWTDVSIDFVGTGTSTVTFSGNGRFFLDEVTVAPTEVSGIAPVRTGEASSPKPIYTIDGRCVGTDMSSLPKGIYIVGGRKVVR